MCISEYKDDSQIIPRSSSVIVKRLPSSRPGKGKAAMYLSGTNGGTHTPTSDIIQRPGGSGGNLWHKGAMSKRFDIKEESSPTPKSVGVRSCHLKYTHFARERVLHPIQPTSIPKNAVTKDDEAAAMAAMFQAQTANWEETQEKMSQLVSRLRAFCHSSRTSLMNVICFFLCPFIGRKQRCAHI
jgi:protein MPE1